MTEKNRPKWTKDDIKGFKVLCGMAHYCFICGYVSGIELMKSKTFDERNDLPSFTVNIFKYTRDIGYFGVIIYGRDTVLYISQDYVSLMYTYLDLVSWIEKREMNVQLMLDYLYKNISQS